MSAPKGYTSQKLREGLGSQFSTVNPVSSEKYGLDVNSHAFVQQITTDTAETGSTTTVVKATAHAALRGDLIRFTSGTLSGLQITVASVVDANNFEVGEVMSVAPSNGDAFTIFRHRKAELDSSGLLKVDASVSSAPIEFLRNSAETTVSEDTSVAANSRPLPVKVLDGNGAEVLNDIKTSVQLLDNAISGSEMQVDIVSSALPAGAATEATSLNIFSGLGSVNTSVQDVVSALAPIETALEILDNAIDGNEMQVDVVSSALPSGASTEATLAAASAKLPASLGQKNTAGSLSVTLSSDHGNVPVVAGALSALGHLRNAYASTSVTTAAYVELDSDIGGTAVKEVEIFDSSGQTLLLAIGAAASEVDLIYICPGGNGRLSLAIPANSRLSIKAVSATASTGEILVNLYG